MTPFGALVGVTLRGLLGRRRTLLMVLLAGLPVLVGLLIRLGGGRSDAPEILDTLVIRTVLPLVALVFGNEAWDSIVADSAAPRVGQAVSRDEDETLVMRRASGNPFQPGTVDALAFDSLMTTFYRRPLRASLRANVVNDQRDPGEPEPSSP